MKYVVAEGRSFVYKNKILSPGAEVDESMLEEAVFQRCIEKKWIHQKDDVYEGRDAKKIEALRRKEAAETKYKEIQANLDAAVVTMKEAKQECETAKKVHEEAVRLFSEIDANNEALKIARDGLRAAEEELAKSKEPEAKSAAELKYAQAKQGVAAIESADLRRNEAKLAVDTALDALNKAENKAKNLEKEAKKKLSSAEQVLREAETELKAAQQGLVDLEKK